MDTQFCTLASDFPWQHSGELIALIAVGGGILMAIVSVIGCSIARVARTNQVEKTRREIAAYVAEGSITPEEGQRMMETAGKQSLRA